MTTPLLIGNWKSNTTLDEAEVLLDAVTRAKHDVADSVQLGVAAPFPWLPTLTAKSQHHDVVIGAQTCSATGNGAYTGEVSVAMLSGYASFVLVGHSERRALYGETDEIVHSKLIQIISGDLMAVLCIGEVLGERQAGEEKTVIKRQLLSALEGFPADKLSKLVVAYEPVWAIGTGVSATADDAEQMCSYIRMLLDTLFGDSSTVIIQYGGSANEKNARSLLQQRHVGGLLVGGASLKPDVFTQMITEAASA